MAQLIAAAGVINNVPTFYWRIPIMQWTDHIRQVKIILLVAAVAIAVASLAVSHVLVRDLYDEERSKMEIWAEAMHALSNADETTDLGLVLKVMDSNNTIPLIVLDGQGNVQTYRNLKITGAKTAADSTRYAHAVAQRLQTTDKVIPISMGSDDTSGKVLVCYDDSVMLKRLATYPYIQLGVVMIFVIVAIFALLTSKRAEQNKVWVGLSKETAHQLGTPISSLMAWTEVLKESYPDETLLPEMEKDVRRLQLIADRFSKIGSTPEPTPTSLTDTLNHVVDYMDRRTSRKVRITKRYGESDITVHICPQLFEWVIENLCKNAVDAMEGEGEIGIAVSALPGRVAIDVSDTGKGIRAKDIGNVFRPGFTTKRRGWGLGLSLAKRIIEEYHRGRIFVKNSVVGVGTTFRIELRTNRQK